MTKAAVLNSLASPESRRGYQRAVSTRALHGGRDSVDAQEEGLRQRLAVGLRRCAVTLQEFDLQQVEDVRVGVAQQDRLLDDGRIVEQLLLTGNRENGFSGTLEVLRDPLVQAPALALGLRPLGIFRL